MLLHPPSIIDHRLQSSLRHYLLGIRQLINLLNGFCHILSVFWLGEYSTLASKWLRSSTASGRADDWSATSHHFDNLQVEAFGTARQQPSIAFAIKFFELVLSQYDSLKIIRSAKRCNKHILRLQPSSLTPITRNDG